MSKLLFKMYGVPEDEIEDVRELCEKHEFEVYETDMGRWGIGLAAIWLRHDEQYPAAKEVLDEYQRTRYENAQDDRIKLQSLTFLQGLYVKFKQDPNQFLIAILALTAILGLSLYPFLNL